MCGMQRTTVSPSSSSTSRSTPCVAGCWGPMLMSMCSPWTSSCTSYASPSTGTMGACTSAPPGDISGLRVTLYISLRSAISAPSAHAAELPLLASGLPPVERVGHRLPQHVRDLELHGRVVVFGLERQGAPGLLGAGEAAAQREVLPQRVPLGVV